MNRTGKMFSIFFYVFQGVKQASFYFRQENWNTNVIHFPSFISSAAVPSSGVPGSTSLAPSHAKTHPPAPNECLSPSFTHYRARSYSMSNSWKQRESNRYWVRLGHPCAACTIIVMLQYVTTASLARCHTEDTRVRSLMCAEILMMRFPGR